jgi:hypothetical protein
VSTNTRTPLAPPPRAHSSSRPRVRRLTATAMATAVLPPPLRATFVSDSPCVCGCRRGGDVQPRSVWPHCHRVLRHRIEQPRALHCAHCTASAQSPAGAVFPFSISCCAASHPLNSYAMLSLCCCRSSFPIHWSLSEVCCCDGFCLCFFCFSCFSVLLPFCFVVLFFVCFSMCSCAACACALPPSVPAASSDFKTFVLCLSLIS